MLPICDVLRYRIVLDIVRSDQGKPIERWGRKVTGLRAIDYDSGTAGILFREPEFGQRFSRKTLLEYSCTRAHVKERQAARIFRITGLCQNLVFLRLITLASLLAM